MIPCNVFHACIVSFGWYFTALLLWKLDGYLYDGPGGVLWSWEIASMYQFCRWTEDLKSVDTPAVEFGTLGALYLVVQALGIGCAWVLLCLIICR